MINEKYSYKSFQNKKFLDVPASDFDGEIIGSNFYQENKPNSEIFPAGISCTFSRCNLDNVAIPKTCVVDGGSNKQIKVQNDLTDWVLNSEGKPVEPMDRPFREAKNISCDPRDIPATKQTATVFEKVRVV